MNRVAIIAIACLLASPAKAAADDVAELVEDWDMCLSLQVAQFAQKTTEPAETIVAGAFGNCAQAETYARQAWERGTDYAHSRDLVSSFKQSRRERLIGKILKLRAGGSW